MLRTLNFAFVVIAALACLGLYRIAEEARVTKAALKETQTAIVEEQKRYAVLGAEWARATQPARIAALAERYLALADRPAMQLSSLQMLPHKTPLAPLGEVRTARAAEPAFDDLGVKIVAFRIGM